MREGKLEVAAARRYIAAKARRCYLDGDPVLTDAELREAVKFFEELEDNLTALGAEFHLAASELRRMLQVMRGWAQARGVRVE